MFPFSLLFYLFALGFRQGEISGFVFDSIARRRIRHHAIQPNPFSSSRLYQSTNCNPPAHIKILILPGFGNDSSDYYLSHYPKGSLVSSLIQRGWDPKRQIHVLPIERSDWLKVFVNGIFDLQFWQGVAPPTRPAFRWYLNRIVQSIEELTSSSNTSNDETNDSVTMEPTKVILMGHSAGGWLARAVFFLNVNLDHVEGIVTLGTPHVPPPPELMDMTRGALKHTASTFPGAYHDNLFYITVVGDAVKGIKQERKSPFERTSVSGFAYNSYKVVCGIGDLIGDGVVPKIAAHLDGALQLNLEGVYHSITVPENWYGSESVIDQWHSDMLNKIRKV
jgi:PGAP1-like protein